jgi:hypothetical protein
MRWCNDPSPYPAQLQIWSTAQSVGRHSRPGRRGGMICCRGRNRFADARACSIVTQEPGLYANSLQKPVSQTSRGLGYGPARGPRKGIPMMFGQNVKMFSVLSSWSDASGPRTLPFPCPFATPLSSGVVATGVSLVAADAACLRCCRPAIVGGFYKLPICHSRWSVVACVWEWYLLQREETEWICTARLV